MNHINHGIEVYSRNIQPEVEVRGSFDKPQARGLSELQTSDDLKHRKCHTSSLRIYSNLQDNISNECGSKEKSNPDLL